MKIGIVLAENKKWWAFLSPVIMNVSKTDFSHCAVLASDANYSTVYHSEWPIGHSLPLDSWTKIYNIKHYFMFDVEPAKASEMMLWLSNQVHKPYSVMQLIYILIYKALPFSRPYLQKRLINGDYSDICTEFVASFMEKFFAVDFKKNDDLIDLNDVISVARTLTGVDNGYIRTD